MYKRQGGLGGRLGRLPRFRGGELGEAGQVVGVAGVALAARGVLGGDVRAEVVGGDPAVQLLPAAADRLQRLGEHGLEGAELGVDVRVRPLPQGLRVGAAFGGLGVVRVLVALLVEALAAAEELLAAPVHGADGLGEDDLEVGELAVDVVVGLGPDLVGLAAGLGQDPVGLGLGLAGDLGLGDQRGALGVGGLDDPSGLLPGLLGELLLAAEQLLGLGEGAGQGLAHLFQHGEQLGAVDHARGRHGHGSGGPDRFDDLVELLLHVHRVLATLCCSVEAAAPLETDGTTVRPVGRRPTPGDVPSAAQRSPSRFTRAAWTVGGSRWETSPPQVATSLTSEDDRKLYVGLVGTKSVSTPERPLFIWAICSS